MLHERQVFFSQGIINIEGLYSAMPGTRGAVISHPHPMMGGDMGNPVVQTLTESLSTCGISTLRFNFRGVGMSEGIFDNGRGEQEDVLAAVTYIEGQGARKIILAGYSFGAWVNAGVTFRKNLLPALFVSPPINLFSFDFQRLGEKIGLIICGDRDSYCPLEEMRRAVIQANCHLEIISNADHFLLGREEELSAHVRAFASGVQ